MGEAQKRVWDNIQHIGEFTKTSSTKTTVDLVARDGVKLLNIRAWYKTKKDPTWKPAFEGTLVPIRIPVEEGTKVVTPATELLSLITKALEAEQNFPLDNPDNYVYTAVKKK